MFENVQNDDSVANAEEKDSLGFTVLETDLYDGDIKMCYFDKASSGALMVHWEFKLAGGETYKESMCIASGDAKGNKTYYEKDGDKFPLPGYTMVNSIIQILTEGNASLADVLSGEVELEEKTIKVRKDGKDELAAKSVFSDILGMQLHLAIAKNVEDHYKNAGETQDKNEIKKVADFETKRVANEILKDADATFMAAWLDKNQGKVFDNSGKGGSGKSSGVPQKTAGAPKKNLFGKK
jgi:hypothetical protein